MVQIHKNRAEGNAFEKLFLLQSRRNGLLATKNNLTAKYLPTGRLLVEKSELDYRLVNQAGRVGYFDCKSFAESHFTYSTIDVEQIKRAATHNFWSVPAGFVIWFRAVDVVAFFSGRQIEKEGPRSRFEFNHGLKLGKFHEFDLRLLLTPKNNTVQTTVSPSILQLSS